LLQKTTALSYFSNLSYYKTLTKNN